MVSASKGLGSAGGVETDSAQNLISKAQVYEVIKGLNVSNIGLPFILFHQIREGLFTEDDLKQLEGGYSVSDSE